MTRDVWYTFGNHFHWVDMQWLWGYGVLGASIRDMLAFTAATGARGNLNFDAVGYEKLAAEDPAALDVLRDAVHRGEVEIVGGSYGQPYPLFHHGESAVRQLSYGVRAVHRLLGVRPRSFWEEEFAFFPQLPQLLVDCGYQYASLFFQWTWHTPHVPEEQAPAIWWEGLDGSTLLTAPRGPLNLHQWPEDFAALQRHRLLAESPAPVIQQWLELLPSPDWMCRSELLVHGVRRLADTPGVRLRYGTLAEVLDAVRDHAVPRRYSMDQVFHGMSLGKNGDYGHRASRTAEQTLLAAETLSVLAGRFGRPYPHWDVYPVWELEEAWRELLAFQHHDNDECEGLCGHVGYAGLARGQALADHVLDRTVTHLAARTAGAAGRTVAVNPLSWPRPAVIGGRQVTLPAAGYTVLTEEEPLAPPVRVAADIASVTLQRDGFMVSVDRHRGVISRIADRSCGPAGLGNLRRERDGQAEVFTPTTVEVDGETVVIVLGSPAGDEVTLTVALAPERDAVDLTFHATALRRPDGRHHAALMTLVEPDLEVATLLHDTPYALTEVTGRGSYQRKYPTEDWMTSSQVFETIRDPLTGLQLVDLVTADGAGLLWLHDGGQGFLRAEHGVWNVLSMYDPWDEDQFRPQLHALVRVLAHDGLEHADRWRLAQEFTRPPLLATPAAVGGELPPTGSLAQVTGHPGAVLTAIFRETEHAAAGIAAHVSTQVDRPTLLRLVEFHGTAGAATVIVDGTVARAWRVSALGEFREPLLVAHAPGPRSSIVVPLRGHEIATLAIDLVEARKQTRDLDAHREVWATVHRTEQE